MRIVIAGPPKAGNVWLKCILAQMYDLTVLNPQETPARPQYPLFREWVAAGGFRDGTIFHQHFDYSEPLADAIAAVPAHSVTIVRDPYDAFVSSYFTIQQHAEDGLRRGRKRDTIVNKSLDDPAVLDYLQRGGFQNNMQRAREWMESGRTVVVRYEALHRDPITELTKVAAQIAPVSTERMAQAVEACSADNMRKQGGGKSKHVRAAKVGDSRDRLGESHLAIFREKHADLIRALGYEVR